MVSAAWRLISRAAISEWGLKVATPSFSSPASIRVTSEPGGNALASGVMSISLLKAQGWPERRRRERPLAKRMAGRVAASSDEA